MRKIIVLAVVLLLFFTMAVTVTGQPQLSGNRNTNHYHNIPDDSPRQHNRPDDNGHMDNFRNNNPYNYPN